ncbi:MAG: HlyD family efflux transporter periplasmic adaptor subunit [Tissierellaceae bacterium]
MTYEKRKRDRKKNQILRALVVSSIFIFIAFKSIPSILANNAKTVLPEKGTLIETISAQGFLIKDELLIKSKNTGSLVKIATEGERLPSGIEIATVDSIDDMTALRHELELIENSIAAIKKSHQEAGLIIDEKLKTDELQIAIIEEIQNYISLGRFDEIYLLKEKLILYDNKGKELSLSNTLTGQSIENLERKRDEISNLIKGKNLRYFSPQGGIISYEIDGFEEIYLPKDFENYSYDKLNTSEIIKRDDNLLYLNEPVCKIIDNFEWYLAVKIENLDEISDFQVDKAISLSIEEDKHELKGRVVAINKTDNKAVIVIKLTTMLHDYYSIRFPKVEIIRTRKEGYKLPNESIVDNQAYKGVYIKDKNGIVKFRPINIIGQDNKYTYIDRGDQDGKINVNEEEGLGTVKLFDEVFVNTTGLKDGQILN